MYRIRVAAKQFAAWEEGMLAPSLFMSGAGVGFSSWENAGGDRFAEGALAPGRWTPGRAVSGRARPTRCLRFLHTRPSPSAIARASMSTHTAPRAARDC